ncbi:ribonuclease H-like domain-containing protein [Tanacetum coccineum]
MTLQEPTWNMDIEASSHLADNTGMLTSFSNQSLYKSVFVGNGQSIPMTNTGHSLLHMPQKPLHLHHVLVTPNSIKNLISVRKFTHDNDVSVEFDAYGFSVKNYQTRQPLLCFDSIGDLYYVTQQPSSTNTFALLTLSPTMCHKCLGHLGEDVLRRLKSGHFISCNKSNLSALCHACQLAHNPPMNSLASLSPPSAHTNFPAQIPFPIITNTHHMVTRAKFGISKPLEHMNCHVTTTSPLPRSHLHALYDLNWQKAMADEYNALISNKTWALVPRQANVNVVHSMWLFRHKFNADGSLSMYKTWLVANGQSQQQGIGCDETFSLVVKPAMICTVLSLTVSRDWPIH